jgi:hypothetical protein
MKANVELLLIAGKSLTWKRRNDKHQLQNSLHEHVTCPYNFAAYCTHENFVRQNIPCTNGKNYA